MAQEKITGLSAGFQKFWSALTDTQRRVLIGIGLVLVIFLLSGWLNSMRTSYNLKKLERSAAAEKKAAEDLLRKAAVTASEIKKAEVEINKKEEIANEKYKEFDIYASNSNSAQRELERERSQPRPDIDTISGEQLCKELAELGYPCK